jgi:hypothetical protein
MPRKVATQTDAASDRVATMDTDQLRQDPEQLVGLEIVRVEIRDGDLYVRLEHGIVVHAPQWEAYAVDDPFTGQS